MQSKIKTYNTNLLQNKEFSNSLQLEATLVNQIKGGHSPYYLTKEKGKRLVATVNLLTKSELNILNTSGFTTNN